MRALCIRTKQVSSDQKRIKIEEYINTAEAFRSCDPQSGSTLTFTPKYKITVTVADLKTTYWTNMEEVWEKYSWFFQDQS